LNEFHQPVLFPFYVLIAIPSFARQGTIIMALPDQLRLAIGSLHQSIEQTPLARAMLHGTLDLTTYVWWLSQMNVVHLGVEEAIRESAYFQDRPLFRSIDRSSVIVRDLVALNASACHQIESCVLDFVANVEEWALASPWKLLGVLYVLEGSRMGSLVLAKPVARSLGLQPALGVGLDYHLEAAAQRPQLWQQFRGTLTMLDLSHEQRCEVEAAAVATMSCLHELYQTAPVGVALVAN
jgi:heme oxygenase